MLLGYCLLCRVQVCLHYNYKCVWFPLSPPGMAIFARSGTSFYTRDFDLKFSPKYYHHNCKHHFKLELKITFYLPSLLFSLGKFTVLYLSINLLFAKLKRKFPKRFGCFCPGRPGRRLCLTSLWLYTSSSKLLITVTLTVKERVF
jgi:hypothetical protein